MEKKLLPQPYEKFEASINDIKAGAVKARCIGGGSESTVYEIEADSQAYAAKFAVAWTRLDRPRDTAAATQRKIDAGLAGLEQIEAASTDAGVAVYKLIGGKTLRSMDLAELEQITEAQMTSFFEIVDNAAKLGIEFDPWNQDGSNAMYSPEQGFTLLDYFVDYAKTTKDESRINGYKPLGFQALKLAKIFGTDNYDFQFKWSLPSDWTGGRRR